MFKFILGQSKIEFHTLQNIFINLTGMLINYSFFIALEKVLLWKFKFPVEFPSYIFDCGKACEILILKSNENLKYSKLQNCVSKSFFFSN